MFLWTARLLLLHDQQTLDGRFSPGIEVYSGGRINGVIGSPTLLVVDISGSVILAKKPGSKPGREGKISLIPCNPERFRRCVDHWPYTVSDLWEASSLFLREAV
jgi:hypothetical protein